MKYVLIGKIVNTHGIRGEIRLLSDFEYKDRVFISGMKIYIGKEKKEEEIATYRHHKMFDMITLVGYNDINQVLKYKGLYVFVNRNDIKLMDGEYLLEEIVGLKVIYDNVELGVISKIQDHNGNKVLVVKGKKEYLIPYNNNFIEKIEIAEKIMMVKNVEGLI